MTMAIELGAAVHLARAEHRDPIEAVITAAGGRRLFGGKIVDVERRTTGGFLRGQAVLDGLDDWSGHAVELDFQNEWLVARLDGEAIATVPHLICLLDVETGEAIGTETARYGQRVAMVAMTAPELFRSEAGLRHVGPRAMGYDLDPIDPLTVDLPFDRLGGPLMGRRIGVDVGGTNTDAALVDGRTVEAAVKSPTTEDILSGITAALAGVPRDRRVGRRHRYHPFHQRRDPASPAEPGRVPADRAAGRAVAAPTRRLADRSGRNRAGRNGHGHRRHRVRRPTVRGPRRGGGDRRREPLRRRRARRHRRCRLLLPRRPWSERIGQPSSWPSTIRKPASPPRTGLDGSGCWSGRTPQA